MQAKRTIKIGSYRMDITVESNHFESTVGQQFAWYSVEYRLYVHGIVLSGTTYYGKEDLKLLKGLPEGTCGMMKLQDHGKLVPIYLAAKYAELVEKTVSELKARVESGSLRPGNRPDHQGEGRRKGSRLA